MMMLNIIQSIFMYKNQTNLINERILQSSCVTFCIVLTMEAPYCAANTEGSMQTSGHDVFIIVNIFEIVMVLWILLFKQHYLLHFSTTTVEAYLFLFHLHQP